MHSVTKHLTRPVIAFLLPAQRDGLPRSCNFRATHRRLRVLTNLRSAFDPGLNFTLDP
jgi:hypothetical protein